MLPPHQFLAGPFRHEIDGLRDDSTLLRFWRCPCRPTDAAAVCLLPGWRRLVQVLAAVLAVFPNTTMSM